jgi:hypothetical protein
MRTDRQTDMADLVVAFRRYANSLKDVPLAQRDLYTHIFGFRCYFLLLKHGYSETIRTSFKTSHALYAEICRIEYPRKDAQFCYYASWTQIDCNGLDEYVNANVNFSVGVLAVKTPLFVWTV